MTSLQRCFYATRRWAAVILLVCLEASLQASEAVDDDLERYITDVEGRRFRVSFDPGNATTFGLDYAFDNAFRRSESGMGTLGLAIGFRSPRGQPSLEERYWLRDTTVARGRFNTGYLSHPTFDVERFTLFSGQYVRYTRDPYITLPATPPRRVWFPFNTGFSAELLSFTGDTVHDVADAELEVLSSHLLLDFFRSPRPRTWGRVGIGIRYDLLFPDAGSARLGEVISSFAPFSSMLLSVHHESRDGLWAADLRTDVVWRWSRAFGGTLLTTGHIELARIVLAVNDQPLALYARAQLRRDTLVGLDALPVGLSYSFGVRLSLNHTR